jgi:hypothetical protein
VNTKHLLGNGADNGRSAPNKRTSVDNRRRAGDRGHPWPTLTQRSKKVWVDNLDVNDPGNPRNREQTRESQRQLRSLLIDWDPIGVGGVPEAPDEYDCMIGPLMHLHDGAGQREIQRSITKEVTVHFGLRSDRQGEAQLAATLIEWWSSRSA